MAKTRDNSNNALWDRELTLLFCDLCLKEVIAGNRPTTFFNKVGWNNIAEKFVETSGKITPNSS